jgi:3-phenylpropionate/trans-cinnamate dioxygenase ferredoxin subunit
MGRKYVVATVDEIPSGGRKIVEIEGVSIGIFNLGGEFFALRNRCPHQGGPLCEGKLWGTLEASRPGEIRYDRPGEIIGCLWHGWEFDIRTGQSWTDPRRLRTRRYPVTVEPGAKLAQSLGATAVAEAEDEPDYSAERVKGPYIAQTYSVSTEGNYIVVEMSD